MDYQEIALTEYDSFVSFLRGEQARIASYARKRTAFLNVLSRAPYQHGKMFEEAGEFLQAVAEGKWRKALSYPDARGTIESEGADVIIASCAYAEFSGAPLQWQYIHSFDARFMREDIARGLYMDNPSMVISVVFSFLRSHGVDVVQNVADRIQFNEETICEK